VSKLGSNDPCWCGSGKKYKRCHRVEDRSTNSSLLKNPKSLLKKLVGKRKSLARPDHIIEKGHVTPLRLVPDHIARPDYALTGRPAQTRSKNVIKTPEQIALMRKAGKVARQVLSLVLENVKPGITTEALDIIAHEEAIRLGGYPSPLNYHGYPKAICTSVNEVICHGIPDDRVLLDGDIVNCDITVFIHGMHGDCSETVFVGNVDEASKKLVKVTHDALMAGIKAVKPGGRVREIGRAIEDYVKPHGYGVVRSFVGHGIGEVFHMDPQVPHYFDRSAMFKLQPGMTFTIEPMINIGHWDHRMWSDNWTAVTIDFQRSAQFEHTLLLTETGIEILTLKEGLEQPFLNLHS
jgi:methionyl aminopeptidase